MRVVTGKETLRALLRGLERLLFAGAVVLLGYCGFVLLDARAFQQQQARSLEQQAGERFAASIHPVVAALSTAAEAPPLGAGDLVGLIEIERLGLSVIVAEGVDKRTLRRAAGRIPGTALPGQFGYVGLAGHRDTFFRPLERVRVDDVIVFTTPAAQYRYRVVFTRIVEPTDVSVLDPGEDEMLTLVTCHPFYFVGPAPNRFVVRAERL